MTNNDQRFLAERIRTQYIEKTTTELDALRELDRKVKLPANIFGYTFGSISAIIMGSGMSLVMTDIGSTLGISNSMVIGIVVGILGLGLSLLTYPIYNAILKGRKRKYGKEIIELSKAIIDKE